MGQIADRGALRLKLETHAALPQRSLHVCGNGSKKKCKVERFRLLHFELKMPNAGKDKHFSVLKKDEEMITCC